MESCLHARCPRGCQRQGRTGEWKSQNATQFLGKSVIRLMENLKKSRFAWLMHVSLIRHCSSYISQRAIHVQEFSRGWRRSLKSVGLAICQKSELSAKVSSAHLLQKLGTRRTAAV